MHLLDDDTALVEAALKGSTQAWEKLVRRYEDRIFNQGLRLTGNRSDAMDLMQEVFLEFTEIFIVFVETQSLAVGSLELLTIKRLI